MTPGSPHSTPPEDSLHSLIPEVLDSNSVPINKKQPPSLTSIQLSQYMTDFLAEAKELNKGTDSIRGYEKAFARFLGYWQEGGKLYPFSQNLCVAFAIFLDKEGLSANTRQVYLSALRLLGKWLVFRGVVRGNPMDGIRSPKITSLFRKQPLSLDGVTQVLQTLKEETLLQLRDKTILYLMLKTGVREIEVIRATIEDYFTVPEGQILRIHGKGREEADNFVVLMPEVKALLDSYLARRAQTKGQTWPAPEEPLFLTLGKRQGHAIKPRTIQGLVRWWLTAAQVKSPVITGHSLRHTAATMALEGGAPITAVKDMLRHSSLKQTNIYVHTLDRMKRGGERFITQY